MMKKTFQNSDVLLTALAFLLAMCSGCQFQGGSEPDPQPEPFPSPDPINTNGPDPVDPDPVDPDPINTNGESPAEPTADELLVGAWRYLSGIALNSYDEEFDLRYVEFANNGTATLYFHDNDTETKECRAAVYAHSGVDDLVIGQEARSPKAYKFEFDNPDTLYVTNGDLETSIFTRESSVPVESRCLAMREAQRFEIDVRVDGESELGYDGLNLWVTEYEGDYLHYPVDTSTGVLGEAVDFGGARQLKFMQDGDIWSTCGCGGNSYLDRHGKNSPVKMDTFDVNTQGFNVRINSATINGDNDEILIQGYDPNMRIYQFIAVDVATKAATEVGTFELDLQSMTHFGDYVLAIHREYLVFIDLDEFKAIATYRLPDSRVRWYGVEMVGTDIWIVGRYRHDDRSVVMRVTTPQVIAMPGQAGGGLDPILNQ
jgi:hypothetical protein